MRFFARTARLGAVAAALTGLLAAAACGGSNNDNQSSVDQAGRRLAHHQGLDQPVLRRHAEGRQGGRGEEQRRPHRGVRKGRRRRARADPGDRERHRQGPEGHPDHAERTGVNSAIKKARDAGLFVIALDTPPDPADTVDITFATDNFKAGKLIGQWTGKHTRPASPPRSPCSTCSTTRSSRSTTTATRAS